MPDDKTDKALPLPAPKLTPEEKLIQNMILSIIKNAIEVNSMSLMHLPDELLEEILLRLPPEKLFNFTVNEHLHQISLRETLWQRKLALYFPDAYLKLQEKTNANYRDTFIKHYNNELKTLEILNKELEVYYLIKEKYETKIILSKSTQIDVVSLAKIAVQADHLLLFEDLVKNKKLTGLKRLSYFLHMAIAANSPNIFNYLLTLPGIDLNTRDDYSTPLMAAALRGRADFVEKLLMYPEVDVNAYNNIRTTALMKAVFSKNLEVVRLLLTRKEINLNAIDNSKTSALELALRLNIMPIVKILVESGAYIPNKAIHYAVINGNAEMIQYLMRNNGRINTMNEVSYYLNKSSEYRIANETPLHTATRMNNIDLAKILLENKADPNLDDRDRVTPLHIAFERKNKTLFDLMMKHGADINRPIIGTLWGMNNTILHLAASKYGFNINKWLIERGANVEAIDQNGRTPLEIILLSQWKNEEQKEALLELMLSRCKKKIDSKIIHNIIQCCGDNKLKYAKLLLPHLKLNPDSDQETPALYYALANQEIFSLLVNSGANININGNLKVPLLFHLARLRWPNDEGVDLLLNKPGVNVSVVSAEQGNTVLHALSLYPLIHHEEIAKYCKTTTHESQLSRIRILLNRDLYLVSIKNTDGDTPLMYLKKNLKNIKNKDHIANCDSIIRILQQAQVLLELIKLSEAFETYLIQKNKTRNSDKISEKITIVQDLIRDLKDTSLSLEERNKTFSQNLQRQGATLSPTLFTMQTAKKSWIKIGKTALFILACATLLIGIGLTIGLAINSKRTRGTSMFWRRRSTIYQDQAENLATTLNRSIK
ncbi:MAG: ankyrin repeat domain-containing protein [Gammaproteobacteria bacterium]|nr:ankyrin repeat domain-containing protein [Gammaproteobacteria bacterium]